MSIPSTCNEIDNLAHQRLLYSYDETGLKEVQTSIRAMWALWLLSTGRFWKQDIECVG
jgi:hypothetical protein